MLPILLYKNRFNDGTPIATDTAAGYSVLNIKDLRSYTVWKAASLGTKDLRVDCGSAKSADCLGLIGHNLATVGADVLVQCSTDNFGADISTVLAIRPTTDKTILQPFRMLVNGEFESWPNGVNVAPAAWTLGGAGATVAREQVDPNDYGARVTAAGVEDGIYQTILNPTYYRGRTLSFGSFARSASVNGGRIGVYDGAWTYSTYHPGGDIWSYLSVSKTINPAATEIRVSCLANAGANALFDVAALKEGNSISVDQQSDLVQPGFMSNRYWRVYMVGCTSAPQLAVAMIGDMLRFPYPVAAPHIPYKEKIETDSKRSKTGHILGSIVRFKSRTIQAKFTNLPRAFVFDSYQPFWDDHASDLKPFFFGWDMDAFPEHVMFAKVPDNADYSTPLSVHPLVDELTLEMEGVKD